MMTGALRFLHAGDAGLVVELGQDIDEATNAAVLALGSAIEAEGIPGLIEIIPTYRSLLLHFDPVRLRRQMLAEAVRALWPPPMDHAARGVRWRIPVLYGGDSGIDLGTVARHHGLAEDEVVRLHSGADYRVYMIGFAPGFAYLGGLPEVLHTSRRTDPRPKTPPRSISIGGRQAAVSPPLEIPSGWHLLGQTPVRSYDPRRADRPMLFSSGDHIRFVPVGRGDYEQLCAIAEAGGEVAEREDLP